MDGSGRNVDERGTTFGEGGTAFDQPVRTVPGYADLARIGSGGSSVVYRAVDLRHQRPVAVKILDVEATSGSRRSAFQREIEGIGRVGSHPYVVTVLGSGFTDDDRPYLVLPLFERGTFGQLIDEHGPLTWADAVDIGIKLCSALETVHRAGVVHRDIKPGNIFIGVSPEHPLLGDFGISSTIEGEPTQTDTVAVTFGYTAPEVLDDDRPTTASDIYSLSMTIYRLIQGLHAYHAETPAAIMRKILAEADRPRLSAGVPPAVAAVVADGLAKDPADRPVSALAMARRLQQVQVDHDLAPTPVVVADEPGVALQPADQSAVADLEAAMVDAVRRQGRPSRATDAGRGSARRGGAESDAGAEPRSGVAPRSEAADIGGILAAAINEPPTRPATGARQSARSRQPEPEPDPEPDRERPAALDLPTVVTPRKPRLEIEVLDDLRERDRVNAAATRRNRILGLVVLLVLVVAAGVAAYLRFGT